MLFEDLLQLVISVTFEVMNELLHRHELYWNDHLDIFVIFCFGNLAPLVTWIEEFIKSECLRISSNFLDRFTVLNLLFSFLSFMYVRNSILAILSSALSLRISILLLAACHVTRITSVVILALHCLKSGCKRVLLGLLRHHRALACSALLCQRHLHTNLGAY